ncbi:MAG: sulfotransferase domain-containing protein [Nitrospirota bacterium]|nr:sulfotransferase domain-containing protein [Nitrospirota bacterium]
MLPDFICVGPGRAGTSWLYEILREHPGICMARNIKETQYFDRHFAKGVGWYGEFFQDCPGAAVKGEISNRYVFDPRVAERISSLLPQCKIIICFRNPYERIQSVYSFKIREGVLTCGFLEAIQRDPRLIEENRYFTVVEPYYRLFGRDHIFPLFFEDISGRPEQLCRNLFTFLGVDATAQPPSMREKINRAIIPRLPGIAPLTKGTARVLRTMGMHRMLTWAKRSEWLKQLLFKEHGYHEENLLTQEARALIDPVVGPEIDRLQVLIDKDLSHWKRS